MKQDAGALYQLSAPLLSGERVSLAHFAGRVLLIVNTASKCGFTPQYAGLEQLYRTYEPRGFSVLGFPCNQFGAQEPGNSQEIATFCERNYGVSFPIFAKIDVNGTHTDPIFRLLKRSRGGFLGFERISWNFTKFLIDRRGNVVKRFAPSTAPASLASKVELLLDGDGAPSKSE